MVTTSLIWNEILRLAEENKPMPVETSMLGRVPYSIRDGDIVGEVPPWVQYTAISLGLEVLPPDPKRSVYIFRRTMWGYRSTSAINCTVDR